MEELDRDVLRRRAVARGHIGGGAVAPAVFGPVEQELEGDLPVVLARQRRRRSGQEDLPGAALGLDVGVAAQDARVLADVTERVVRDVRVPDGVGVARGRVEHIIRPADSGEVAVLGARDLHLAGVTGGRGLVPAHAHAANRVRAQRVVRELSYAAVAGALRALRRDVDLDGFAVRDRPGIIGRRSILVPLVTICRSQRQR